MKTDKFGFVYKDFKQILNFSYRTQDIMQEFSVDYSFDDIVWLEK
jgi:hypothetical protein